MNLQGYAGVQTLHDGVRTTIQRACRASDDRPVVLKQLRTPFPSATELARLRREFDMARAAAGSAVVEMYGLHAGQGTAWIEMEDCRGSSLAALCSRRPPPARLVLEIACRLVDALDQVHRAGIVHKDLNPSNVVVDLETRAVKLIDFGIASKIGLQAPVRVDRLEGTPSYISPEQTGRVNRTLDWRSDYYSLGATLYHLLTGTPPFPGADPLEIVHAHIARLPAPPRTVNTAVPETLSDIVMILLAKRAGDRYQSAAGLRFDLQRCLSELRERETVRSFPLRSEDRSETLRVPDTLYGREAEIETLDAAIRHVAAGGLEACFVTGVAGSGKTALVGEVRRGGAIHRAHFVSGKFEQFQRDVPYSAVLRGLRELFHSVLAMDPARVDAWRARLMEAVGESGSVLAQSIPEIEILLGKQPAPPEVSGLDGENRFRNALMRLIAAIPSGQPAVLFFDDLQWADSASIALIERLLVEPSLHRTLILGAWRPNEVNEAHPLSRGLARAKEFGARFTTIELGPLALEDVRTMLGETLGRPDEEVAPLAQLGHAWTGGNPFLLHRVVERLGEKGLLHRDGTRWTWDLGDVTRHGLGEDAAGFVAGRLAELPAESRQALEAASCVGTTFTTRGLAAALERSPTEILSDLAPALALKLIHPLNEEWWPDATDDLEFEFAFSHDRIQEAAHAGLDASSRRSVHLRVGRLLRQRSDADVFEVVHHLNSAIDLLSKDEKASLLLLDAEAGRRAMRSGAYAPALQLFDQAAALLPPNAWQADPEGTRLLILDAARAASLSGARDRMETHLGVALAHAKTPLQRATAMEIQALDLAGRDLLAAIDCALSAMEELGVSLPRRPTMEDVQAAMGAAMGALASRGPESVVALPELEDPVAGEVIQLANSIMAAAYLAVPLLLPILAAELVKQTVARGVTPPGMYGYAILSLVLTAGGALEPGHQIAQLTLRLMERFHDRGQDARPGHVLMGHVLPFTLPVREAVARHQPYLARALAAGDHEYAMWIAHLSLANAFYAGSTLEQLLEDLEREALAMRRLGQGAPLDCTEPFRRHVRALRGLTPIPDRMDEDGWTEEAGLATLIASGSRGAVYLFQTQRLYLRYILRDLSGALEVADEGEPYADGAAVTYHQIVFRQTLALVCLGLATTAASSEERDALITRARTNRSLLEAPAAHAPHNHQHRLHIIDAELERLAGNILPAIDAYDAAIKSARENGFTQDEALANELAARFRRPLGKLTEARAYLQDACGAWARWGATAKLRQLEAELPDLVARQAAASDRGGTLDATDTDLDLATLSKATLAITSELRTDRLVERVLAVSMQNAGATRGLLLLERDGLLRLEAAKGDGLSILGTPLSELTGVPLTILQYVARTGARLVLSDARVDARFSSDPALSQSQPLSVLALPLTLRGRSSGLIYLENDLTSDAFPATRIQLQEMLGAQAAISLENARLYDEMEAQVTRRTQELSVANEQLEHTNRELERRVQDKVAEALAASEQMESLTRRLQERVRDRSRELALALERLSLKQNEGAGLAAGTILADSVRILRPIGAGGMGAVYLGEDLRTGERVAVKVVLGSRMKDELTMQRFLRESRASASVTHPAVARTLAVDVSEEGLIFQVQEFVDGESLHRIVDGGRWLTGSEAARLGSVLAAGIAQAHAVGVVHRDIKPSNIMIAPGEPGLKLLDFGIARLAGDASEPQLTGTGQMIGTPDYMAPEQIFSPDHVSDRIDVYSTGLVLYWVLSGKLPHRSVHLAARQVLDPIPLDAVVPGLPAGLTELVMACLVRDPARRPASARLADELVSLAERIGAAPLSDLAARWVARARGSPLESVATWVKEGFTPPHPGDTLPPPEDETHIDRWGKL